MTLEEHEREVFLLTRFCRVTNGCWIWTGYIHPDGYGRATFKKKTWRAHRLSYLHWKGSLPEDKELHHSCKNTRCVNPDHLEPVTPNDHPDNAVAIARAKTHCKFGHRFNEQNTYLSPVGKRRCRICNLAAVNRYQSRKQTKSEGVA